MPLIKIRLFTRVVLYVLDRTPAVTRFLPLNNNSYPAIPCIDLQYCVWVTWHTRFICTRRKINWYNYQFILRLLQIRTWNDRLVYVILANHLILRTSSNETKRDQHKPRFKSCMCHHYCGILRLVSLPKCALILYDL